MISAKPPISSCPRIAGREASTASVSLGVSPLLAHDAETTLSEARRLHARSGRSNLFIKIPGTQAGLKAIEESTFSGVRVNVTLLFSADQYLAAADAYTRAMDVKRMLAFLPSHSVVPWEVG